MIQTTDKKNCCGCSACASICPKRCITMQEDAEGFLYPVVDETACTDCGLCEKTCHELHPYEERTPQKAYAAINKDEEIRMDSSSGGVFHLLADSIIQEGGVVFGARFDKQWQVLTDYAETKEGVRAFMGSKYVQARMETAYTDARKFLQEGRKVLFSGTPCQIAGLHHFMGKPYENLLTVDIICHGTPSPKVWGRYLEEVIAAGRKAISNVQFRSERKGWKRFNFSMTGDEKDSSISLCSHHRTNHFMRAFLQDMILRPSCHACQAKNGRSHSDITIADFWGIKKVIPEMNDDKGTSLVLINTERGSKALDWDNLSCKETAAALALKHNPSYYQSVNAHPKRNGFFTHLDGTGSVVSLIDVCLRPTFIKRLKKYCSICKLFRWDTKQDLTPTPSLPESMSVTHITFRDKKQGWKSYRLQIKLKGNV